MPTGEITLFNSTDVRKGSKAVDREFPLKPDPDRFGANPHPRKVNSDSISASVCYEVPKSSYICNSGRALRPRRARPREQLVH